MNNSVISGNYNQYNNKLTFYHSESKASYHIGEVAAERFSEGRISSLLQKLNPTRVTISLNDKNTRKVSVKTQDLAKSLGISSLRIMLSKFNPFSSTEILINQTLEPLKQIHVAASNYIQDHGDADQFKVNRKKYANLDHSYVVRHNKTNPNKLKLYRCERSFWHDKKVGTGSSKKAKLLTQLKTGKKKVLVVHNEGLPERFLEEMDYQTNYRKVPHFASGKVITWINSSNLEKGGILMPLYAGTMQNYRLKKTEEKLKCSLEAALAVQKLLEDKRYHTDIKPDNIFIQNHPNGEVEARLGDFGGVMDFVPLSRHLLNQFVPIFGKKPKRKNNFYERGECEATVGYMPPELLYSNPYSNLKGCEKAMVFSLGKTFETWHRGDSLPEETRQLILNMKSPNPKDRPDIATCIESLSINRSA